MSDSSQEPTMEEILASIRRIISEDDAPEGEKGPTLPPLDAVASDSAGSASELALADDESAAAEADDAAFDADDDELELTEKVDDQGDLDVFSAEPEPEPEPPPPPPPAPAIEPAAVAALVSAPAAAAAAAAFGKLSGSMAMPAPGRTLEDVVRELLRPMLQQWLDENLPGIVQRAVDAEVARIARGG